MGHQIAAVIGPPAVLARLAAAAARPPLTALPEGLVIAPLSEAGIDAITALNPGAYADGFVYLSEALERFFASASAEGPLAYVRPPIPGDRLAGGRRLRRGRDDPEARRSHRPVPGRP